MITLRANPARKKNLPGERKALNPYMGKTREGWMRSPILTVAASIEPPKNCNISLLKRTASKDEIGG